MDRHPETPRLWLRNHDNGVRFPQNRWKLSNIWNSLKNIDLPYLLYLYLFTFFAGLFVLALGLCIASVSIGVGNFLVRILWPWRGWIFIHMVIGGITALCIWGSLLLTLLEEPPRNEEGEFVELL